MLFSSIPFLFYFLPLTLLVYALVPKRAKNAVLLAASLLFYAWGEKLLVLLFTCSILLGWSFGLLTEKAQSRRTKKALMIAAVIWDLGLLVYFKYADFFISSVNSVIGTEIPLLKTVLPIGISFYTFQLLSYNIDVYRGTVRAQKNLIDFSAYVSMFPQLIAGPIVRYSDVETQLQNHRQNTDMAASGVRRFILGLCKKVLIANVAGEICVSFRAAADPSVLYHWLYSLAFVLQIYFDFSGYSDMAIGLGRIFGFEFMENFNYPYISSSVTEFWRRWHISLGSWFRDYVYIPLGGNRRGIGRQLLNILVVWMLTGLWHGAAWNFVLWGLFFAVLLTLEKIGLKKWLDHHKVFGHIYLLICVLLGFTLFNAPDLRQAAADIAGLFGVGHLPLVSQESLYCLRSYGFILALGILISTPLPKKVLSGIAKKQTGAMVLRCAEPIVFAVLLLTATAYLVDGSFNPFLYFRF